MEQGKGNEGTTFTLIVLLVVVVLLLIAGGGVALILFQRQVAARHQLLAERARAEAAQAEAMAQRQLAEQQRAAAEQRLQDADSTTPANGQEGDREYAKTLREWLTRVEEAWSAGGEHELLAFYWQSPELVLAIDGRNVVGWETLSAAFPTDLTGLELTSRQLNPSDSIAWMTGSWQSVAAPGRSGQMSLLLRFIDGNWRIVHQHLSTSRP